MHYNEHKNYFNTAYKTGSDIWTHFPIQVKGIKFIEKLSSGSFILEIGSGRGLFAKQLAEAGFRVVGIDFESEIVAKTNEEVKNWGLSGKLKFMVGEALHLPFPDAGFDGVCAIGLMENIHAEDWPQYANEVNRVLKPGGFYLNISFSRKTQKFLNLSPINLPNGELQIADVHYHFFEKDEMKNIFEKKLTLISQEVKFLKHPTEIALLESLFQKVK